jgi:hypothetical protein
MILADNEDGTPLGGCSLKSCHGSLYLGLCVWSLHKRMPEARLHVASVDLAGTAAYIAEILEQEQVPYKAAGWFG